jgi:hypothetical protein
LYRSIIRLSAHAEQTLNHAIDVQRRRHGGDVEAVALRELALLGSNGGNVVGRRRASERAIVRSIVRFVSGLYPPSVVLRSTASAFASASPVVRSLVARRVASVGLSNPSTGVSGGGT